MPAPLPALSLSDHDREQIGRWLSAPGTPQHVALRSRIVLAAAVAQSDSAIANARAINRKTVVLWRAVSVRSSHVFQRHPPEGSSSCPRWARREGRMSRKLDVAEVAGRPYWRQTDAQRILAAWRQSGETVSEFAPPWGGSEAAVAVGVAASAVSAGAGALPSGASGGRWREPSGGGLDRD